MTDRIAPAFIALLLISLTLQAQETIPADDFHIVFLGDTGHGESYQQSRSKRSEVNTLETKGYDYSLQQFSSFLRAQDLNIANLETPLYVPRADEQAPFPDKDYIHWSKPEQSLAALRKVHIHTFSLANNHTLDYGAKGLEKSFEELRKQNCHWFGAGMTDKEAEAAFIIHMPSGFAWSRVAVIGCFEYRKSYDEKYQFYATANRPGAYRLNVQQIAAQVKALKAEDPATLIVLYPHWGKNYTWASDAQKDEARQLILAGCDVIVGHGSHMLQEVQQVEGRLIFHSLGNFMFNSNGRYDKENIHPYSFALRMSIAKNTRQLSFRAYPILTNNLQTEFQPRFLNQNEFDTLKTIVSNKEGFLAPVDTNSDEFGYYLEYPAAYKTQTDRHEPGKQ